MKRWLTISSLSFLTSVTVSAVPLKPLTTLDEHIARSDDIFIARIITVPQPDENGWPYEVLYPIETEILHVLKGSREKGPLRIVTDGTKIPGREYIFFSNKGGLAHGSDCLAWGELGTVLMPWFYKYEASYGSKPLNEQICSILEDRLHSIARDKKIIEEEQMLLQRALKKKSQQVP